MSIVVMEATSLEVVVLPYVYLPIIQKDYPHLLFPVQLLMRVKPLIQKSLVLVRWEVVPVVVFSEQHTKVG